MGIQPNVKLNQKVVLDQLKELESETKNTKNKFALQAAIAMLEEVPSEINSQLRRKRYRRRDHSLYRKSISRSKPLKNRAIIEVSAAKAENVSTREVADYYGVTQETVKSWIRQKKFLAIQMGENSNGKILRSSFEFMIQKREGLNPFHESLSKRLEPGFSDNWDFELIEDEGDE